MRFLAKKKILLFITSCFFFNIHAQIPLGTWRTHFSYQQLNGLTVARTNVFTFANNGVFYLDKAENQTFLLSKQNQLTDAGVSAMAFAPNAQTVVLGYENGNVDLLKLNAQNQPTETQNLALIKNSAQITGSKRIRQIAVQNNNAFLATDFGIVLLDLTRSEIKETYRNIGADGANVGVSKLAFANDSIYALTTAGLRAAAFASNVNLQFFGNWRSINPPNSLAVSHLTAVNSALLAVTGRQLWRYERGQWQAILQTTGLITSLNTLAEQWAVAENGQLHFQNGTKLTNEKLTNPTDVQADADANVWITTAQNGLLRLQNNNLQAFLPNGPQADDYQQLRVFNKTVAAVASAAINPLSFDVFAEQRWLSFGNLRSIKAVVFDANTQQIFWGGAEGVFEQTQNGTFQRLPNSPNNVTDAQFDANGNMWVLASSGLWMRPRNGTWQLFNLPRRQFSKLLIDQNGFKWLIVSASEGGGLLVFDEKTNRTRLLTTAPEAGNLPNIIVNDFSLDRDGAIWAATNRGVAVFDNPNAAFNANFGAFLPVFEQRRLFDTEPVTNVATDGGNFKWFSTANGLFRFSPDAASLSERFTSENSPLPSNTVRDIAVEPVSGEVFFLTSRGLVSYRGTATETAESLAQIHIFPNPVTPEFSGKVAFEKLTSNATIKITDMAGRLVYETRSEGGTASWNLLNYNGQRAETGIYLILVSDQTGTEALVGKLAIIR